MKNKFIKSRSKKFRLITTPLNLVMLLLIFSFISCSSDDKNGSKDEDKDKDSVCNNSVHDSYRTVVQGSETREYIIYVPSSYDSNTPTALIINFHGFGDCATDYAMNIGDFNNLNSLADSENFLVAYPQGVTRQKGSPEWDPGDNGTQSIMDNDLYFTEQLISNISNEYNIDLSRVYATGYSNGGMMSYGLACTRPNLIAAAGIMSGTMLDDTCDENESTAIIHFHGIADDVLPYDGNQDYQSISDVVDFWLDHNNIPSSSLVTTELNDSDVVKEEYTGGSENTSVVLYTINTEHDKDGGHVWFSADIEGNSPNKILWDFLSNYSL